MELLKELERPDLDVETIKQTMGLMKQDTLYVSNFPYHFEATELEELFSECGKVLNIRIPIDKKA